MSPKNKFWDVIINIRQIDGRSKGFLLLLYNRPPEGGAEHILWHVSPSYFLKHLITFKKKKKKKWSVQFNNVLITC